MKISKLFHWLYAILMFLPFGLVVYNALASMWSGTVISYVDWIDMLVNPFVSGDLFGGMSSTIEDVYYYLINDIFGLVDSGIQNVVIYSLTYWTCISIIWLVFDVFMYVPLLVHRWIDKAKIE